MIFKRKVFFVAMFLLVFLTIPIRIVEAAGVTESRYCFTIWLKSGEKIDCLYDEHPCVIPSGDFMIVSTTQRVLLYAEKDVHKFTTRRRTDEEINSVGLVQQSRANIVQSGDLVHFSDCRVGTVVRVFSVNGRLLHTARASNDGTLTLDFGNLNQGIYIISTDSITYKIVKK